MLPVITPENEIEVLQAQRELLQKFLPELSSMPEKYRQANLLIKYVNHKIAQTQDSELEDDFDLALSLGLSETCTVEALCQEMQKYINIANNEKRTRYESLVPTVISNVAETRVLTSEVTTATITKEILPEAVIKQFSMGLSTKISAAEIIARAQLISENTAEENRAKELHNYFAALRRIGVNRFSYWNSRDFQNEWALAQAYLGTLVKQYALSKEASRTVIFNSRDKLDQPHGIIHAAMISVLSVDKVPKNKIPLNNKEVANAHTAIQKAALKRAFDADLVRLSKVGAQLSVQQAADQANALNRLKTTYKDLEGVEELTNEALLKFFKKVHAKYRVFSWTKWAYIEPNWERFTGTLNPGSPLELCQILQDFETSRSKPGATAKVSPQPPVAISSAVDAQPRPTVVVNARSINGVTLQAAIDPAPAKGLGRLACCFFGKTNRASRVNADYLESANSVSLG